MFNVLVLCVCSYFSTMYLFSMYIILQAIPTFLLIEIKDDPEYRLRLDNLFKRPSKSLYKHEGLSSVIKPNIEKNNKKDELLEYLDHVKKRGTKVIKDMDEVITRTFDHTIDSEELNSFINRYNNVVQDYFDKTVGSNEEIAYGDIIMIDLAECACRLMYHAQIRAVNTSINAITNSKTVTAKRSKKSITKDGENLKNTIQINTSHIKKDEMHHICFKYLVCRPYPGLTDHFGYFISEVMQLPRNKLTVLLKVASMSISHNDNFTHIISNIIKDQEAVQNLLTEIGKGEQIQEYMNALRDATTLKFEIIHNPKNKDKIKSATLRILLDAIDRLYAKENDRSVLIKFDNFVKSLKKWAKEHASSISAITDKFIKEMFMYLNNLINSDSETRKAVYKLLEILVGNNVTHQSYYKVVHAHEQEL